MLACPPFSVINQMVGAKAALATVFIFPNASSKVGNRREIPSRDDPMTKLYQRRPNS